jgi:hypothetical protein
MNDEREGPGLGKVIYSVDEATKDEEDARAEREARAEVEEADKESFPASDPPSFAGGSTTDSE